MNTYPKVRPELPVAHQAIYEQHYLENRNGTGVVSAFSNWLESWMHKIICRRAREMPGSRILELGAGTLNHLQYENDYTSYDIVEPFTALYEGSILIPKLRSIYRDIDEIPNDNMYDRVLSVAVLEHVDNLPHIIARTRELISRDGLFQTAIPSEGGIAWLAAWKYGTGTAFKKRFGLDYKYMMAHEHLNDASEIQSEISKQFDIDRIRRFPTPFLHGSFYTYIEARPR